MKIQTTSLAMEAKHSFASIQHLSSSIKLAGSVASDPLKSGPSSILMQRADRDYLELSLKAKNALSNPPPATSTADSLTSTDISQLDIPDHDKLQLLLLAKLVKALTGKDLVIVVPSELDPVKAKAQFQPLTTSLSVKSQPDWAIRIQSSESYAESEALSFHASGQITTADGRSLSMDLRLNLTHQQSYEATQQIELGNQRLLDPLTINYAAASAEVTNQKFSFDIDADGQVENLSTLAQGRGFLAMDLNNDGRINDGRELFGTRTDNGFEDLSAYDSDHNHWIDENDAAFTKLRIMTVEADGSQHLYSLADKGIGAIYLGNVSGKFGLYDNSGKTAEAEREGIFLREDGTPGTIQQIDYVV